MLFESSLVFIELAMLPLMPVTTTWLRSVTAFAGFFTGFPDAVPVSPAFASPAFCGTGVLVPVLAVGGVLDVVCADALSMPVMASRAAAQATANGRKRACARDPCNAQRDFMMAPFLVVDLVSGVKQTWRAAPVAHGFASRIRHAGKRGGAAVPSPATGERTHARPMGNGDKTPRAMWRL
jgi:hypothetical protein